MFKKNPKNKEEDKDRDKEKTKESKNVKFSKEPILIMPL
jgi:hypothetical protein